MTKFSKSSSSEYTKKSARFVTVDEGSAGQRIDNFLMRELKDVPRSYIYRILRKGEVRVNKKRIKQVYKLKMEDIVRIPPVFLPDEKEKKSAPATLLKSLESSVILEDDDLIFINKPSGLAVHGGSGVRHGLIETFRQLRPNLAFVELVHRLDKETSGIVMLAKNRPTLLALHEMMKQGGSEGRIDKYYQTLVKGEWRGGKLHIKNTLQRKQGRQQKVKVVSSAEDKGKKAESIFSPVQVFERYSLLKVQLLTGRMHQIRAQLTELDHPILGDSQYGDFSLNRELKKQLGLKRLFLHAYHLKFKLKTSDKLYDIEVPLPNDLLAVMKTVTTLRR